MTCYVRDVLWLPRIDYEFIDDGKEQIVLVTDLEGYPRGYVLPPAYSLARVMIDAIKSPVPENKSYKEFKEYVIEFFNTLMEYSDIEKKDTGKFLENWLKNLEK